MLRSSSISLLLCAFVLSSAGACAHVAPVADDLATMPVVRIDVDGERFDVRLAATQRHRERGFQNVSIDDMHSEAILFLFDGPLLPAFHMRNVAAPLLIAWIDTNEQVIGVDTMHPNHAGYSPRIPIVAALEFTYAHPLADAVREGARISLVGEQN
jgi:uncharacterized protein